MDNTLITGIMDLIQCTKQEAVDIINEYEIITEEAYNINELNAEHSNEIIPK